MPGGLVARLVRVVRGGGGRRRQARWCGHVREAAQLARRGRDLAHGSVRLAGEGIAASPLRPQAAAHVEVEAVRAAVVERDRHADPVQTSPADVADPRSEEHTSELQSLMRISYAVFCLKKKNSQQTDTRTTTINTKHEQLK